LFRGATRSILPQLCLRAHHERFTFGTTDDNRENAFPGVRKLLASAKIIALPGFVSLQYSIAAMGKLFRGIILFLVLAATSVSSLASNFLYLIDTSGSMRSYRKKIIEAVNRDIERALVRTPPLYRAGDHIHLWTFDAQVSELGKAEFRPEQEGKFHDYLESRLNRLKMGELTSLARPLRRALEVFRPAEMGALHIFIYTDGRSSIAEKDAVTILRDFHHSFEAERRLPNLFLVQFEKVEIPASTSQLLATLGGKVVQAGQPLDIQVEGSPAPAPAPAPVTKTLVPTTAPALVSITPRSIQFSNDVAPEIVKPVPIEFKVDPPQDAVSIGMSLETTNLPSGMTMGLTADYFVTAGKQSISFVLRNPQPGRYAATLKLVSSATVEPKEIPVQIEILSPQPSPVRNFVSYQFLPEQLALVELPAGVAWQRIPNLGLSLFYSDNLGNVQVRMEGEIFPGIEIQALPGGDAAKAIPIGAIIKLADLGRGAAFQVRQTSEGSAGQNLTNTLSLRLQPGQDVNLEGPEKFSIPLRFVPSLEMQIESREISLGDVPHGINSAKGTLILQVKGKPERKKIRLARQGNGLAGISISPTEIMLQPGKMSVTVEFTGFDSRPPGLIEGEIVLIPDDEGAPLKAPDGPITVRGKIPDPAKIIAELENPMVTGQALLIRAHFDSQAKGALHAVVRPSDSKKDYDVKLADDGLAENGDATANDGIYSGAFRQTENLGKYQITISGVTTPGSTQSVSLVAPYYFKPPAGPLAASVSNRKPNEFVGFKMKVFSGLPSGIPIQQESGASPIPLKAISTSQTLEPGENVVDVLVGLTPETKPGNYKCLIYLVANPVEGTKVRIPLRLEIRVLSLFQYAIRLLSLTVLLAFAVFLAMIAPWKKLGFLNGVRRRSRGSPRE
jgi:Mg-chelatase subunit ChlD